ncbi:MAG: hypothetical protein KC505_00315 [Myxococcales bacterium]|nr:hypothetical protein [Myxococcales bacterium]
MRKLFLFAAMLFVLPCLGQNSLSEALLGNETFKSGGYYERVTCINFALGSVNTVTWKDVHLILKEIDSASDRRRVLTLLIESKKIDESNDSDHLYLIVELETHAYDAKSSLEIIDKFVKNLRSHQLEIIVQATKDGEVSGKYAKRLSEKLEFEQLLYLLKLFESQRNARLFAQSVLSEESFGQLRWEHIRIICENFKDRSYRSEILAYLKEKRVKIDSSSNDVCSSLLSINQMVEIEVSSLFNFIPEEQKFSFHREEMTQIISALKSDGGMYRERFLRRC